MPIHPKSTNILPKIWQHFHRKHGNIFAFLHGFSIPGRNRRLETISEISELKYIHFSGRVSEISQLAAFFKLCRVFTLADACEQFRANPSARSLLAFIAGIAAAPPPTCTATNPCLPRHLCTCAGTCTTRPAPVPFLHGLLRARAPCRPRLTVNQHWLALRRTSRASERCRNPSRAGGVH